MSVNLGDNLDQRDPWVPDTTYKCPYFDKGAPFPRRPPPSPLSRRLPSQSSPTRPFISCIHSCNLAAAMDSGVNMGEILGPIVLAVTINVSPSPFLDRVFSPKLTLRKKSMLYGTCVVQWYNYYTSGYNDPLSTRCVRSNVRRVTPFIGSAYTPPTLAGFSSSGAWCWIPSTLGSRRTCCGISQ